MINKHIKSLPHHPKRVILISLILALIIGSYSYLKINKKGGDETIPNPESTTSLLSANHNLTLGFLSGGRIKSVLVKTSDTVTKGQVLAELDSGNTLGALTQAKASFQIAQNNYLKIINGATGAAVDVAKAAVHSAEVNLEEVTKQQKVLVSNAYQTLLNSSLTATSVSDNFAYYGPTVSGTYTCGKEGSYILKTYSSSGGLSVNYSGLEDGVLFLTDVPRPLGSCGLFLSSEASKMISSNIEFKIEIPNKNASNYSANNNAYLLANQNKEQAIALAQATLDQAKASLAAVVTNARPEDVGVARAQMESASGAVQIAQAAYDNTTIKAPADGTVVSVAITPGQIAIPNAPAIEFISNSEAN
jgi:HlyD family secretion protein